jgi:hypothetical protein
MQRRRKRNDRCEQKEPHHYALSFIGALICCGKENADVRLSLTYFAARPGRLSFARERDGEDSIEKQLRPADS